MKSFFKFSIAAVAIVALSMGASSAFAGPVENGSDAKVSVGGIIWTGIGYVTGFEDAAGETPTSSFDVNNETRLNVSWGNETFTGHWEYWMRNDIGRNAGVNDADGDLIMGWLDWNATEALQVSVGQLEDRSWMERSVDWDIHNGTAYMPGATPGAYNGFPEDKPGLDVSFTTGAIKAGLALYAVGVVSGAANDQTTSSATTFIPHVEFKTDMMWISVYYEAETVSSAGVIVDNKGTDDESDDTVTPDWGSTDDTSNSMIGVSTKFDLGVGTLKVQYLGLDGDAYTDPATDVAAAFLFPLGEDKISLEYDMFDPGGDADAQSWVRVGYTIALAKNSGMRVDFATANDGNSNSSRPSATWFTSF